MYRVQWRVTPRGLAQAVEGDPQGAPLCWLRGSLVLGLHLSSYGHWLVMCVGRGGVCVCVGGGGGGHIL